MTAVSTTPGPTARAMGTRHALVLGGSVFVGRTVVDHLLAAGWNVSVLNRGSTSTDLPHDVERLVADRTDTDQLRSVLGGRSWDAVFDVSGFVMVAGSGDASASLDALLDLVDGATGSYVYVSSIMAYDQSTVGSVTEPAVVWTETAPTNTDGGRSYGGFKAMVETELLRRFADRGFPALVVRPAAIYGPRNNIFDMETPMYMRLRQHRPVLLPHDGRVMASYGHVDDLCTAMLALADVPAAQGEIVNVTTNAVTTRDYVDHLASVVGEPANVVALSDQRATGVGYGHLFGAQHHAVLDTAKLRRLVAVEPIAFADGHRHTYEWFLEQGWGEVTGDEPFTDPVWRASWDFAREAELAASIDDLTDNADSVAS